MTLHWAVVVISQQGRALVWLLCFVTPEYPNPLSFAHIHHLFEKIDYSESMLER
jgi:hypothetical protein